MLDYSAKQGLSLGETARRYEATLLAQSQEVVDEEMRRRWTLMQAAVQQGLSKDSPRMQMLEPSARGLFQAAEEGRLPVGGIHARAAARALAVMQINSASGVVIAAPTGGSAGIVPATICSLAEQKDWGEDVVLRGLWAAGGIGLIVGNRATFTASMGGCQVEVTAAGAMAAAAVVEMAGGSPQQACDAAAVFFQNQMGLVCDPVQGVVEIPCHTRNAAAASSAIICAELVLGGFVNHLPLDETVDAMYQVGQIITREVQCSAERGCSACPSAKALTRRQ
jgi:L-serine dehydratase